MLDNEFYIGENTIFFEGYIHDTKIKTADDLIKYLPSNKYDIDERQIFFQDNFNENLEPYLDLISKCNQLIFCSIPKIYRCTTNELLYLNHYHLNFTEYNDQSKFNYDINYLPNSLEIIVLSDKFNSCINLDNLTKLKRLSFGYDYNKPVKFDNLLNLIQLSFGFEFNYPLEISHLDNLNYLKLSELYNQKFNFPPNLLHLHLGFKFLSWIEIPHSVKSIKLNCNNNFIIDNLPNTIETLLLGPDFCLELNNLPNSIKRLKFGITSHNYQELNNFPESIEIIEFSNFLDSIQFEKIPKNLKKIKCNKKCKIIIKEILSKNKIDIEYYKN